MKLLPAVSLATATWLAAITSLHAWLNLGRWEKTTEGPAFRVGFLPVT